MCDLDGDACVICMVTLRCDRSGQRGEPGPVSRLVKSVGLTSAEGVDTEPTGYRSSQSPLPCKPSRTFHGRMYLSTHFLLWSLLWRLVRLYLSSLREGEETDQGFLLCRLVSSTDSDLVFVRGSIFLRWLASRKKNVTAWNSGGAWTLW